MCVYCLPRGMAELLSLTSPRRNCPDQTQTAAGYMPAPQTATTCSTPAFLVAHDFRISSRDVEIVALAIPTDSSFVKMRLSGWFA